MAPRDGFVALLNGIFFAYLLKYNCVGARSTGAPVTMNPDVCSTMTPQHFSNPSQDLSPYTIIVNGDTYTPTQPLTVTISTAQGAGQFKGILLLARRVGSNDIVGSWSVTDSQNFQTVSCGQSNNAVTHQNSDLKDLSISFIWIPPSGEANDIFIAATFVQQFNTFWVNVTSSIIQADPCTNNQCQNGGFCQPSTGYNPPYHLSDPCTNNQCQNGGFCQPSTGSNPPYICVCSSGFSGQFCQMISNSDSCEGNQCQNGATCSTVPSSGLTYTCNCPTGFTGLVCHLADALEDLLWFYQDNAFTCNLLLGFVI
nr:putative defense protein 1 [Lytechinus pictus]